MNAPPRQGLPKLDPLIHPQVRLQLMTSLCALAEGERLAFGELQDLLNLSAGNLSTHLTKLEEAGYVKITKAFRGRRPVTWIETTSTGRKAYEQYLEALHVYLSHRKG